MDWFVTLTGRQRDIEFVLSTPPKGLRQGGAPTEAVLEFVDPDHDEPTSEAFHACKALLDAQVRHLNGFGRLRWGRAFAGLTVKSVMYPDPEGGPPGQVVFGEVAHAHLSPEEFAAMVERLGHPRPPLPAGLDDVNALTAPDVVALAAGDPEVARVLRLVELMLDGDDQIDWAAGYAALEVIEQSARTHRVDGKDLGWWVSGDRERFRRMANSFEAVGIRSRHPGRQYAAPKNPMSPSDGAWFIRAVVARWIAWLVSTKR